MQCQGGHFRLSTPSRQLCRSPRGVNSRAQRGHCEWDRQYLLNDRLPLLLVLVPGLFLCVLLLLLLFSPCTWRWCTGRQQLKAKGAVPAVLLLLLCQVLLLLLLCVLLLLLLLFSPLLRYVMLWTVVEVAEGAVPAAAVLARSAASLCQAQGWQQQRVQDAALTQSTWPGAHPRLSAADPCLPELLNDDLLGCNCSHVLKSLIERVHLIPGGFSPVIEA